MDGGDDDGNLRAVCVKCEKRRAVAEERPPGWECDDGGFSSKPMCPKGLKTVCECSDEDWAKIFTDSYLHQNDRGHRGYRRRNTVRLM